MKMLPEYGIEYAMKKDKDIPIPETHRSHYQEVTPQPIEVIDEWLTDEQFVGFCLGTALKYLGRFNMQRVGKGGLKDIEKAIDYLSWMRERLLHPSTES